MSVVIQLLSDLIAIPSVNPFGAPLGLNQGEGAVVEYLRHRLEALGLECAVGEGAPGRPNLMARLEGGPGPSVIFEAHTDTVSVDDMTAPFTPALRDGRLYGRGACDNKGSLAAMVAALEATARQGTPPGDVWLWATADEEFSGSGVQYLLDQGLRGDMAVAGEPTGLQLVIAHKGALRVRVTTRGRACHSSEPEKGENAIYRMVPVLQALQSYAQEIRQREPHPLVGRPAASVGVIHGGKAPNIVPPECYVVLDRRLLPQEAPALIEEEIRAYLAAAVPEAPHTVTEMLYGVGLETPPSSPVVARCEAALDRVLGSHVTTGVQYGTDAARLSTMGVPAVVLGPGDIAQAHTAEEWVEVAQVEQAVAIYREIMWPEQPRP